MRKAVVICGLATPLVGFLALALSIRAVVAMRTDRQIYAAADEFFNEMAREFARPAVTAA